MTDHSEQHQLQPGQVSPGQPVTALTEAPKVSRSESHAVTGDSGKAVSAGPHPAGTGHGDPPACAADLGGKPVNTPADSTRSVNPGR
ncbi:hypothetical protein ACFC1R_15490 [Kitasatospora sp. NPDC056138]|uniref:hypothetical protein n=1 Tax=Kitasatospora sp. NPDC056138 TaxID=3345724 RepID=UPI0035E397D2